MENLELLKNIQSLQVNSKEFLKGLDELYYKKKINEIEKYKSIEHIDKQFRTCNKIVNDKIKTFNNLYIELDNLYLTLQVHLTRLKNEIENIDDEQEENQDDEIGETMKDIYFSSSDSSSDSSTETEK